MLEWPYAKDTVFFQVSFNESFNRLFAYSEKPLDVEISRCGLPYYPTHPHAAFIQTQFMAEILNQGKSWVPGCLTSVDLSMNRLEPDSLDYPSEYTEALLLRHAVCAPEDRVKVLTLFLLMRVLMTDNNTRYEFAAHSPQEKEHQDTILKNFPGGEFQEKDILEALAPLYSEAKIKSLATVIKRRAPFSWEKKTLDGFSPVCISEHPELKTTSEKIQWKILHVPTGFWIQGVYFPSEMCARMAIEELAIRARERDLYFEDVMSRFEFGHALNLLSDLLI